jgi:MFS family permease
VTEPTTDRTAAAAGARARGLLLAALSLGVLLVGVELMITAVALPRIVPDLADWTELRRASWIVNGYLVAYVATMPLAGRAADRFGLPALFGLSLLVFGLGSLLSGAARELDGLIAARVVQGIGGGAVVPLATAGASHLYEGHGRARALGIIGAMTFLGMALGPFAGAAILDTLELGPALAAAGQSRTPLFELLVPSWRWIFYLGAPFALLAAVYAWAAAPAWPRVRQPGRLDVLGAAFFTIAVSCALLALTWLGTPDAPGGERGVAALAAVSAMAALAATLRFRTAAQPFLELRLFRERTFGGAVLLSLLTGYALATAIIGGAVFVDRVRYGGPDEQRLALGGLAAAMAAGALLSGFALRRLGVLLLSLAGLAVGAAGLAMLAGSGPDSPLALPTVGLLLFGLGFGLTVTPRSTAAVEALGRSAFGLASAGVTVARMLGMAAGLAILTAFGANRIEALSVVLRDAAARDAVLPPELRGRPLQDGLVVDVLERWASEQAAGILAGLFAVAAVVMIVAALPALQMRGAGLATGVADGQTGRRQPGGASTGDDDARAALAL